MGGKPSKGTKADRRLKENRGGGVKMPQPMPRPPKGGKG